MADRTARFSNWFQIISNVAIIVGLGLVIYELNQSKQLAYAQYVHNDMARYTDRHVSLMADDPREALVKAALHPDELEEQHAVTLDAFYREVMLGWVNCVRTTQIADLGDRGCWNVIANEARFYFGTEPGRRWIESWGADWVGSAGYSRIVEVATNAAHEEPVRHHGSLYKLLLARNER